MLVSGILRTHSQTKAESSPVATHPDSAPRRDVEASLKRHPGRSPSRRTCRTSMPSMPSAGRSWCRSGLARTPLRLPRPRSLWALGVPAGWRCPSGAVQSGIHQGAGALRPAGRPARKRNGFRWVVRRVVPSPAPSHVWLVCCFRLWADRAAQPRGQPGCAADPVASHRTCLRPRHRPTSRSAPTLPSPPLRPTQSRLPAGRVGLPLDN